MALEPQGAPNHIEPLSEQGFSFLFSKICEAAGYLAVVVEHLVPEELSYELEVRDLASPPDVESRQRRLKRALKAEAENGLTMISSTVVASLVPLSEWKKCRVLLNQMQCAYTLSVRHSPPRRAILSRAQVLFMRMKRYKSLGRETESLFEGLLGEVKALIRDLEAEIEEWGQNLDNDLWFTSLNLPGPQETGGHRTNSDRVSPEETDQRNGDNDQGELAGPSKVTNGSSETNPFLAEEDFALHSTSNSGEQERTRGREPHLRGEQPSLLRSDSIRRSRSQNVRRGSEGLTYHEEEALKDKYRDSHNRILSSMSVEDMRKLHETLGSMLSTPEPKGSNECLHEQTFARKQMIRRGESPQFHGVIPIRETTVTRIGLPVSKWKIEKFGGQEEQLPRFLSTVRQFALAEATPKEELFRSRIHLFRGDAADFVATATDVTCWDELVTELTRYCLGSSSDADILRKMSQKVQGNENCAVYITRMELMFGSLARPIAEEDKVEMVIRGLKFAIRQALAGSTSIKRLTELRNAAQRAERLLANSSQASDNRGFLMRRTEEMRPTTTFPRETEYNRRSETNPPRCFRCGQTGHLQVRCNNPPACFRCGEKGVERSNCPKCSGKAQGRSQ